MHSKCNYSSCCQRRGRERDRARKPRLGLKFHNANEEEDEKENEVEHVIADDESTFSDYEECSLHSSEEIDSDLADDEEHEDPEAEVELEEEMLQGTDSDSKKEPRLETTRILTPADFARLAKLKEDAKANGIAKPRTKNAAKRARSESPSNDENIVSTTTIEGYKAKQRMNKAERLATVMEGRKDREKFGSRKGQHSGSSTNRQKSRLKNALMLVHKRSVIAKKKFSLREKQIRLRRHIDKQKKSF